MPAINLRGMNVDALLTLRGEIEKRLGEKRSEMENKLSRRGAESGASTRGAWGRRSAMKGRKVPPKYRGPDGETWAGRGARPRWLAALLQQGRKIEDFAIDKWAAAGKRVAKKSRRKHK